MARTKPGLGTRGEKQIMKKLTVTVCVCTECVMNGAIDLIESIESLNKLKVQLRLNTQIDVQTSKCIGEPKHGDKSPMVEINGEYIENANAETVMAKIIALTSKDVK